MFDVFSILATDNYIVVNKDILKAFGLNTAVLLGELASEYKYYEREGKLEDGMFYASVSNVQERTSLTKYQQKQCLTMLEEKGIVKVRLQRNPNRRYIQIDADALGREVKKFDFRGQKTSLQKSKNLTSIKNNKERKTKEDNICQDAKDVIDYLNEMTGKRFRHSEASLKNVRARLNEGFTVDDCKTVVEKKASEWMGTDFETFLRPSTLFAPSHFEDYLNQRTVSKTESHDDRYRKANASYDIDDIERIMSE